MTENRNVHVFLGHVFADIEAAGHGAAVALLAEHLAVLLILVFHGFRGGNGQVAVLQLQLDFFLLKAGQIHRQLIAGFGLLHVRLHHAGRILAVEHMLRIVPSAQKALAEIIENIHQVLSEYCRQETIHHKYLRSSSAAFCGAGVVFVSAVSCTAAFPER